MLAELVWWKLKFLVLSQSKSELLIYHLQISPEKW